MKKFYIAARARHRVNEVTELQNFISGFGLHNAFDWVESGANGNVKKPYKDNPESSSEIGDKMLGAAFLADVVILLHDTDLEGALMEYGVARYAAIKSPQKLVLVVQMGGRDSIFLHRGNIKIFESIEGLKEWFTQNF